MIRWQKKINAIVYLKSVYLHVLGDQMLEGSIEYIFKTIDNPEGYIDS